MDRYNNNKNTSPVQNALENDKVDVPRSSFNLSYRHDFNANIGAIIPIDLTDTLPNSKYKLSIDLLALTRNPLVRRLTSGMRIYVHSFGIDKSKLWEGAYNYYTKGRSGNMTLQIPKWNPTYKNKDGHTVNMLTPMSVADYLGYPIEYYDTAVPKNAFLPVDTTSLPETAHKIGAQADYYTALPFVMYNKICRDSFFNSNLIQSNNKWYPDNEEHFILSYECTEANVIDYGHENNSSSLGTHYSVDDEIHVPIGDSTPPVLGAMHYRQFKGDYFSTALPFADIIRGDVPTIDLGKIVTEIDWDDVFNTPTSPTVTSSVTSMYLHGNPQKIAGTMVTLGNTSGIISDSETKNLKKAFEQAQVRAQLQGAINLNNLRSLEAYTIFKERMARTNGSYNEMIKAQFGSNPNVDEGKCVYIGGTYQDIVFNDVVQTSESSTTPLGTTAGRGASASSGYIGDYFSKDYGYIMTVLEIVPDVIYTQGVSRHLTRHNQSEEYFPILNNLSPQPILNKELYVSGVQDTDNDIYGYTERFSEYKSKQNRASGLMAVGHDYATYDSSCIMARRFSTTPTLSNDFVTMSPKNIDMSIFSYSDEPPFDISAYIKIDAVQPLPYVTVPGGLQARA